MANYSQPPYGQWFPPPGVPLTPPVPPPNQQSGPQHQFPPGLPGLNFQAYNQNMQQAHYSSWPAPPPPQLSPFAPVFPPPFPATAGFPVPPPPIPPSAIRYAAPPAPSAPAHQTVASQPEAHVQEPQLTMSVNGRVADTADSDKEEGELSDGDGTSAETRRVLQPPRSVPERSVNSFGSTLNGQGDSAGSQAQRDYGHGLPHDLRAKREAAKGFVTLLQQHRIGYSDLSSEDLDVEMLRQLYEDLGFPVQAEPALPDVATVNSLSAPNLSSEPQSRPVAPVANEHGQDQRVKAVPAITTNDPQILPVKSTKSPADRQEYIARLQALKSSKQPNASKTGSSHPSPSPADADARSSRPPVSASTEVPTSATGVPSPPANAQLQPQVSKAVNKVAGTSTPKSEAERARQTELIKQRLEMMRAQGKLPPSNPSTPQVADTTGPNVHAKPVPTAPAVSIPTISRDSSSASAATLPGLFLNSPSFPTAGHSTRPAQVAALSGNNFATRKRPVASDFDDDHRSPPQPGPRYTRPLGQSPHEHHRESMVISISDDESEGSDMDLDEDHASAQAAPQPIPSRPTANGTRSAVTNGSSSGKQSAVPTPPASRTPAEATSEELLKREQAILKLKAKIAALSSKQKLAQAKKDSISSGSSAPENSTLGKTSGQGANTAVPQLAKVPTATQTHQAVVAPAVTVGGNTSRSSAWMKQRRMEIQSALRALDSDLENDNARLAQLEKEMAEIRAKRDKEKRDREKLVEELESFGIDTEGMGDEELLARKEKMDHEKEMQSASQAGPSATLMEVVQPVTKVITSSEVHSGSPQKVSHTPRQQIFPAASTGVNVPGSPPRQGEPRIEGDVVMEGVEPAIGPPQVPEAATSQDRVSEGPVASFNGQVTAEQVESATSVDDEDFYSPEPAVRPIAIPAASTQQELPDSDPSVRPPSEEGEMEMTEGPKAEEEEYNPEEPISTEPVAVSEPEASTTSGAGVPPAETSPLSSLEDEGEIYEPEELPAPAEIPTTLQVDGPDAGEIRTGVEAGIAQETQEPIPPVDASQVTGPENETDYQDEMDLSTSSDESDTDRTPPEKVHRGSISHTHWNGSDVAVADDLAPELQPQGLPTLVPNPEPASSSETVPDRFGFTPYESPLRMFKSYRYHPNYSQDVTGGFLSLTYSHQIDPEKPLCRFEAVGGTCNDPHCDGQHFRDMKISGDKLLVQLGTANPGKTPEERQQWNDGLKLVLQELRRKSIKDPNGIAVEIANYRRQFLKDDTRVVNL